MSEGAERQAAQSGNHPLPTPRDLGPNCDDKPMANEKRSAPETIEEGRCRKAEAGPGRVAQTNATSQRMATGQRRNYPSFRPTINVVEEAEWLIAAQGGTHSTGPVRKQTEAQRRH